MFEDSRTGPSSKSLGMFFVGTLAASQSRSAYGKTSLVLFSYHLAYARYRWRSIGDISCDAAIEAIFWESSSTGKDLLESLQEHVKNRSDYDAAAEFLAEVSEVPPTGIRVNAKDVLLARTFFLDYSIQIMQALLHYSLAGGFAR